MTKPPAAEPGILRKVLRKIKSLFSSQGDLIERRRAVQDGAAKYGTYGTGDTGRHGGGL
ncbi:hypothetical protein [Nakamurella lactea]|uniref:hypothetical protein n=1 Tax=Nakamurella lactea TaxID=459515 RepID=UPI00042573FE|nr:hypothetical protein [Nakamurella lactea]